MARDKEHSSQAILKSQRQTSPHTSTAVRGHPLGGQRGPQITGFPATTLVTRWDVHSLWTFQFYSTSI